MGPVVTRVADSAYSVQAHNHYGSATLVRSIRPCQVPSSFETQGSGQLLQAEDIPNGFWLWGTGAWKAVRCGYNVLSTSPRTQYNHKVGSAGMVHGAGVDLVRVRVLGSTPGLETR